MVSKEGGTSVGRCEPEMGRHTDEHGSGGRQLFQPRLIRRIRDERCLDVFKIRYGIPVEVGRDVACACRVSDEGEAAGVDLGVDVAGWGIDVSEEEGDVDSARGERCVVWCFIERRRGVWVTETVVWNDLQEVQR